MGFYVANEYQTVAETPQKKSRLGFFSSSSSRAGLFASQPLETHWETGPTPTKTASGISFFLSRDPINAVVIMFNLYAYVDNEVTDYVDTDGRAKFRPKDGGKDGGGKKEDDPCASLAPWNKPETTLGDTSWCFWCGKAFLTDVGKALPSTVQDCIKKHEGQHEKRCKELSFCDRCLPPDAVCNRNKDEITAYGISISCAEGKLKENSLTDEEKQHLECYLKNAKKQKEKYEGLVKKCK